MGFKKWLENRRAAIEAEKLRRANPFSAFGLSLEQYQKIEMLMDEIRKEHSIQNPIFKPESPVKMRLNEKRMTGSSRMQANNRTRRSDDNDDSCSLIDTIVTIEILESIF